MEGTIMLSMLVFGIPYLIILGILWRIFKKLK